MVRQGHCGGLPIDAFWTAGARALVLSRMARMRLTEYHQLIVDEFGESKGKWISHSHVLPDLGATPDELIERDVDPRRVWLSLCDDFDVPKERRLGVDYPTL